MFYFSVGHLDILVYVFLCNLKLIWSKLMQLWATLYFLLLIWFFCLVILNNFLGLFCRRDEDLAFCKSARQLSDEQLASFSLVQQECCLFVFLDGSAHYFDDFLKVVVSFQI